MHRPSKKRLYTKILRIHVFSIFTIKTPRTRYWQMYSNYNLYKTVIFIEPEWSIETYVPVFYRGNKLWVRVTWIVSQILLSLFNSNVLELTCLLLVNKSCFNVHSPGRSSTVLKKIVRLHTNFIKTPKIICHSIRIYVI